MVGTLLVIIIVAIALYTWRVGRDAGGYLRFFRSILSTGPGRQVTLDPYIVTTILCIWVVYDTLEVGISLVGVALYILIAVFMASLVPRLYLLQRFLVI